MRRLRVIGLIGAGAISSATICSLYLAYTLSGPASEASSEIPVNQRGAEPEIAAGDIDDRSQAYLTTFLADADPQVRMLAVWGLVTDEEGLDQQQEILRFLKQERDPAVRMTLYRYLHGQPAINTSALVDLIREEQDDLLVWLAGCDLLAAVLKVDADEETRDFFDQEIVPELKKHAVHSNNLTCKIASIIVLRRAGTDDAIQALEAIAKNSADDQVGAAASSAFRLVSHTQSFGAPE
ncbi:MAG TPA: hypothetical protein VK041_08405 [Opitutales bacterium]|nr:hypothetical protein [Opitutales bacterium]